MRRRARAGLMAMAVVLAAGCAHSVGGVAGPAIALTPTSSSGSLVPVGPGQSGPSALSGPSSAAAPATTGSDSTPPTLSTTDPTRVTSSAVAPTTGTRTNWALPPAATTAAKNQFGDTVAKVGQVYSLRWADTHQDIVAFVVDAIRVDQGCRAGTPKAGNGHYLVITLRVEVRNATVDELDKAGLNLTASSWTAYTAAGPAQVGAHSDGAQSCVSGSGVPFTADLSPSRVNSGKVALDVTDRKGTVVLNISGVGAGWEYRYG